MMARPFGFQRFLCLAMIIVSMLGGRALAAEPLRLVTFSLPPFMDLNDEKAPGFSVEVLRQVFAVMGQEGSFEELPFSRSWAMVAGGERDGIFGVVRTGERERICSFPDEPLTRERWVFSRSTGGVLRSFWKSSAVAQYTLACVREHSSCRNPVTSWWWLRTRPHWQR